MNKLGWTATALGIMTVALACSGSSASDGESRLDDQGTGGTSGGADLTQG